MAVKTTSAPLDRLTRTEWRNTVATWLGKPWSGIASALQTEIDRILNESHEKADQMYGHQPWAIRPYSFSTAASDADYSMPADFRHVISIVEVSSDGTETRPYIARDVSDKENAVNDTDAHPWATRDKATWYYNGMTGDEPPVQEWVRIPTPTSVFTVRMQYRPFFALIADSGSADAFVLLPPSFTSLVRNQVLYAVSMYLKDYTGAAAYERARNDDFETLSRNDTDTSEDSVLQQTDSDFSIQLG